MAEGAKGRIMSWMLCCFGVQNTTTAGIHHGRSRNVVVVLAIQNLTDNRS